jgi:hypothetical protein
MAKILHLRGLVRSAAPQTKQGASEPWGSRLSVLSEPKGDTVDVVAFERVLAPLDALALEGCEIDCTVDVSAVAGSRGGSFLNVSLVSLESVEAPASREPATV